MYLQQVAFILLHDAVAIEWGEDSVYDPLRVLMIESLSCHQTGCHQSWVLPQPAQELPIDALLKAECLITIHKLCVLQKLGMLTAFRRRSLHTGKERDTHSDKWIAENHVIKSDHPGDALEWMCKCISEISRYYLLVDLQNPHWKGANLNYLECWTY